MWALPEYGNAEPCTYLVISIAFFLRILTYRIQLLVSVVLFGAVHWETKDSTRKNIDTIYRSALSGGEHVRRGHHMWRIDAVGDNIGSERGIGVAPRFTVIYNLIRTIFKVFTRPPPPP